MLRERDHQIFEAYRRYSFYEVVRLVVDYVVTVSAEYLDPVKDALYCEAPDGTGPVPVCDTVRVWLIRHWAPQFQTR